MPSTSKFDMQDQSYQEEILPNHNHIFTLEASSYYGWDKYASKNHNLGFTTFGLSGEKDEVLKEMNFDFESLKQRILEQYK
jgi:transketolase